MATTATKSRQRKIKVATVAHILVDATGSMLVRKGITMDAFNEYFEGLKGQEGIDGFSFTVGIFNSDYGIKYLCQGVPLDKVPKLTDENYQPHHDTPLYDAFGKTITEVVTELEFTKATAALVLIQTDGQENASEEYTKDGIKKLVEEKQKENWQFVFLGCGIDAMHDGAAMGMAAGTTMSYTDAATKSSMRGVTSSTVAYAAGGQSASANFFQKDTADDADTQPWSSQSRRRSRKS